jgi:hypothetical protein
MADFITCLRFSSLKIKRISQTSLNQKIIPDIKNLKKGLRQKSTACGQKSLPTFKKKATGTLLGIPNVGWTKTKQVVPF